MIVATVASLAFLAASCGFLAWVLNDRAGDTVSVSARLAAETTITTAVTTAAPTAQAASDVPPTTEDVAGPGPTDAPAATAPAASAPAAVEGERETRGAASPGGGEATSDEVAAQPGSEKTRRRAAGSQRSRPRPVLRMLCGLVRVLTAYLPDPWTSTRWRTVP